MQNMASSTAFPHFLKPLVSLFIMFLSYLTCSDPLNLTTIIYLHRTISKYKRSDCFPHAIETVFPDTEIQQCIVHKIRNTTKFVSYKESKSLMAGLKCVYAVPTEEIALAELDNALMRNGVGNTPKSRNHRRIIG